MRTDILREPYALIDLPMTLQQLKHSLMTCLSECSSVFFEEFIEAFLFELYVFLQVACLGRGRSSRMLGLQ